jgi:hypothetical protein
VGACLNRNFENNLLKTMQPQTLSTIQQLSDSVWFSAVGVVDSQTVSFVNNWNEAIENCCSLEWEELCLEAVNQYCDRVAERAPERLEQWNLIVAEIKKISIPLVRKKIDDVVRENNLPQCFEDTVQWDVLHLCMEAEFSDVFPPGFYASQAFWYSKGHFPCGWRGNFPKGSLLVF